MSPSIVLSEHPPDKGISLPIALGYSGAMTIKLICLDADDTLWHNMRHFNATQDALTDMLQPFADVDVTRERLIACEIRNLPLYGYGAKGFTLSMIETAMELTGGQAPPMSCARSWPPVARC